MRLLLHGSRGAWFLDRIFPDGRIARCPLAPFSDRRSKAVVLGY